MPKPVMFCNGCETGHYERSESFEKLFGGFFDSRQLAFIPASRRHVADRDRNRQNDNTDTKNIGRRIGISMKDTEQRRCTGVWRSSKMVRDSFESQDFKDISEICSDRTRIACGSEMDQYVIQKKKTSLLIAPPLKGDLGRSRRPRSRVTSNSCDSRAQVRRMSDLGDSPSIS